MQALTVFKFLNCLHLFQVWRIVIGKLKTCDADNCSQASLYFQSLDKHWEERRLTRALPVLFAYLAKVDLNSDPWKAVRKTPVSLNGNTTIMPSLDFSYLLECRLTCRAWNAAVEDMFVNAMQAFPETNQHLLPYTQNTFVTLNDVQLFQNFFNGTHYEASRNLAAKSPFLGGSVRVILNRRNRIFLGAFRDFVRMYGNFIKKLEVIIVDENLGFINRSQAYIDMISFITLLPKVRFLTLRQVSGFSISEGDQNEFHFEYQPPHTLGFVRDLEATVATYGFPTLHHLETFNAQQVDAPLWACITASNTQLKHVEVHRFNFVGEYKLGIEIQNLRKLRIKIDSTIEFAAFETCRFPKLESLKISFGNNAPWNPLHRLLTALNENFNKSKLSNLELELPPVSISMYQRIPEIDLCNLQMLCLTTSSHITLDWLSGSNGTVRFIKIIQKKRTLISKILGLLNNFNDIDPYTLGRNFRRLQEVQLVDPNGNIQRYKYDLSGVLL